QRRKPDRDLVQYLQHGGWPGRARGLCRETTANVAARSLSRASLGRPARNQLRFSWITGRVTARDGGWRSSRETPLWPNLGEQSCVDQCRWGFLRPFSKYSPFYRINQEALNMATQMTKSQLIEKIATGSEVAKKDVKGVLETLATVGYKELKKTG